MDDLISLNNNNNLDFLYKFQNSLNDNPNEENPYLNVQINSKFHDINSLLSIPNICNSPIYLSLNAQSLNSKFENLNLFITELLTKNINVEIIAIQETWNIELPELVSIRGYHPFIFKMPEGMRGGGVGSYIKKTYRSRLLNNALILKTKSTNP